VFRTKTHELFDDYVSYFCISSARDYFKYRVIVTLSNTVWREKGDGGRQIYIFNIFIGHPLNAHFLPDFLLVCFDLDDFNDWLLFDFEIFICFFRSTFFLAATDLVSLPFEAFEAAAFLGTSFCFKTFLEDETFLTTTTFSVFLTGTYGFLTGAGIFLDLTTANCYFLGLTVCFFSIFLEAFLIYKALLALTLDLDSFTFDSLDLDSFTLVSFDLDSFNFESFDLDSLDLDMLALDFSGVLDDFEILDDFDLFDSLLGGVFNLSGDTLDLDLDSDFCCLSYLLLSALLSALGSSASRFLLLPTSSLSFYFLSLSFSLYFLALSADADAFCLDFFSSTSFLIFSDSLVFLGCIFSFDF